MLGNHLWTPSHATMKTMNNNPIDSLLLLGVTLVALLLAAYGGKFIFKRRLERAEVEDDEAKLVLGAILSLLMLLIGLVLSIAVGGYTDRVAAQENEALAIGSAFQRTELLPLPLRQQATDLLEQYLEARIHFFDIGSGPEHQQWRVRAEQLQSELWDLAVVQAQTAPNSVDASVLKAYELLYRTLQKTQFDWRHHIPVVGWWALLAAAFLANALIGYNIRGIKGENWLIVILPLLTTGAFFLIAEIDLPGAGIIRVLPDGLIAVHTLFTH